MDRYIKNSIYNKDFIIPFVLILIPILSMMPILLSDAVISTSDGIGYELQIEFIRQAVANGEFPIWNKYIGMGTPQLADIQNKVCYPIIWICAIFPTHFGFKMFCLVHLILCSLFSFSFFTEIKCDKLVAALGAIIVTFSNLIILRFEHINILACIVWFFFILRYLILTIRSNSLKTPILLGAGLSMQFFAGFPQMAVYSDLLVFFIYIFFLYYPQYRKMWFKKGLVFSLVYIGIIAVQAIPLIELMRWSGRNDINYEYFSSYSSDFRMLLNMFSPTYLGNWCRYLGINDLEFPTDMYIGIIPLILAIYAVVFYIKEDKRIKLLFVLSIFSFIYSCAPRNLMFVGKILYKIPILNGFRVAERMGIFFIVFVFIISIIGLDYLIKKCDYLRLFKCGLVTFAIFNLIIMLTKLLAGYGILGKENKSNYLQNNHFFIKSYILMIIGCVIIFVFYKFKRIAFKKPYLFIIVIGVFTIWEVNYFNFDESVNYLRFNQLHKNRNHIELFDNTALDYMMQNDISYYRYYVNYDSWVQLGVTPWGIRVNGNIWNKLSSPQSYITFNNPNLLKFCDTEYGMMINNANIMLDSNPSFISMLGNKYIVQSAASDIPGTSKVYNVIFESYPLGDIVGTEKIEIPILFEAEKEYVVNIHINGEGIRGKLLIVNEKGRSIDISNEWTEGDNFLTVDIKDFSGTGYLCWEENNSAYVQGIRIEEKVLGNLNEDNFKVCYKDDKYEVYENLMVQPIIFAPDEIIEIPNAEKYALQNKKEINFIQSSYIEAKGTDENKIQNSEIEIDINDCKMNSFSAIVNVKGEVGFLNFSQSFYPGWKMYVDGKECPVVQVNGLIQGGWIESGKHEITFKYYPDVIVVGGGISLLSVIISIFLVYGGKRIKSKHLYINGKVHLR